MVVCVHIKIWDSKSNLLMNTQEYKFRISYMMSPFPYIQTLRLPTSLTMRPLSHSSHPSRITPHSSSCQTWVTTSLMGTHCHVSFLGVSWLVFFWSTDQCILIQKGKSPGRSQYS